MANLELFFDHNYQLDVDNKINYFKIITEPGSSQFSITGYTLKGTEEGDSFTVYRNENTVTLIGANVSKYHVQEDKSLCYCYEFLISNTVKKVVLEKIEQF